MARTSPNTLDKIFRLVHEAAKSYGCFALPDLELFFRTACTLSFAIRRATDEGVGDDFVRLS